MQIRIDIAPCLKTVEGYAEDAVRAMQRVGNIRLDYSVYSLGYIDSTLWDWRDRGATPEVCVKSLYAMGSYAGEVLRRHASWQWVEPEDTSYGKFDELFLYMRLPDGREWRPVATAFNALTEGREYSLERTARKLLSSPAAATSSTAPSAALSVTSAAMTSVTSSATAGKKGALAVQIRQKAQHAVMQFEKEANGALDYSEKSLSVVEDILARTALKLVSMKESDAKALVECMGCYMLEVAQRRHGGKFEWHEGRNQPVLVAGEPNCRIALRPFGRMKSRLAGNLSDNIVRFYVRFVSRLKQAAEGENGRTVLVE